MNEQCSNCKFFRVNTKNRGWCRRHPPKAIYHASQGATITTLPDVINDDWCGEYQSNLDSPWEIERAGLINHINDLQCELYQLKHPMVDIEASIVNLGVGTIEDATSLPPEQGVQGAIDVSWDSGPPNLKELIEQTTKRIMEDVGIPVPKSFIDLYMNLSEAHKEFFQKTFPQEYQTIMKGIWTPPSFIPKGWIAMDRSGDWYWYSIKPVCGISGIWSFEEATSLALIENMTSKTPWGAPPITDWKESLIEIK